MTSLIFYDVIKQEQWQGIIAILVCLASVAISFDEIKILNQFFQFLRAIVLAFVVFSGCHAKIQETGIYLVWLFGFFYKYFTNFVILINSCMRSLTIKTFRY